LPLLDIYHAHSGTGETFLYQNVRGTFRILGIDRGGGGMDLWICVELRECIFAFWMYCGHVRALPFFSMATEAHQKTAGRIKNQNIQGTKNQRRDALDSEVFQLKTTSTLMGN